MNQPIPNALANTVLLADHDEAIQRAVVDAVEQIIANYLPNYLQANMGTISAEFLMCQQPQIERLALRALKYHFTNASNI
jgi:hypothetical protein